MYRRVLLWALVVGIMIQPSIALAAQNDKVITIGFSNWSKRFVFYQDVERGVRDASQKYGVKVLISDPNGDQAVQQSHVENFLTQGIDALILIPIDSKSVVPTVEEANAARVPVITVDIAAAAGKVVTHIASDNFLGGRLAAQRMAELLGGKGQVALITYPVISSTIEREKGFMEEIAKYPSIKVLARQSGESQRDKAMALTENYLERYPDIDGIFAVNDMQGLGALAAVQAAGRKDIAIIGFDAEKEAVDAMNAGTAYKGSVAQQPYLMGQMAVEVAMKVIKGEKVPSSIPVPVQMVVPAK